MVWPPRHTQSPCSHQFQPSPQDGLRTPSTHLLQLELSHPQDPWPMLLQFQLPHCGGSVRCTSGPPFYIPSGSDHPVKWAVTQCAPVYPQPLPIPAMASLPPATHSLHRGHFHTRPLLQDSLILREVAVLPNPLKQIQKITQDEKAEEYVPNEQDII